MEDISGRKEQILRAVVVEYVETAEPVGSQVLVKRYRLGVGPATIRNEMAEMAERGLLEQPHTSAGRIPSDSGYRYYVDRLGDPSLPTETAHAVREISRTDSDLESLLHETCRLLARVTHYTSFAATLREKGATIRQVTLTGVSPRRALMILVFNSGELENLLVDSAPEVSLSDLHQVSELITEALGGKQLRAITRMAVPDASLLRPPTQQLLARAWKSLKSKSKALSSGTFVKDGTQYLVGEPEFQRDISALSALLSAIEDVDTMQAVLDRRPDERTTVTIGREHEKEELKRAAVIATRFFVHDEEAGAIAVLGPTRMRYEQTIPVVEHAAKALSDAMVKLMG